MVIFMNMEEQLMDFDPNIALDRQYDIEQQQNFIEAKEAAHKFFEAMSKLDTKYFAKLIEELGEEGLMKKIS